jgi:hypothetical protein
MVKPKFFGGLGFRDIDLFNLALLGKQARRIQLDGSSLSVRVLKVVYFPQTEFMEARLGSAPSRNWRAILDGRDVLERDLIRRIGDGETTDIWKTSWLPRDGRRRPVRSTVARAPQWVCELIDSTTASWDQQKLHTYFVPVDREAILNIPICSRRQADFWA